MNRLSRIFRRTPSLRTRVAFATAIGAAIVVLIVGTIVWIGITNDRRERLDRRLDEAAGFAIPFIPRGLGEIPRSPNDQDAVITVRGNGQVTSNSNVTLPKLDAGYADTYVNGVRYRVRTVDIRTPEEMSVAVGATYDATIAETNNLHRRVILICLFAIGAAAVLGWLLATFAVRPFKHLAQQARSVDAGDEAPDVEIRGATEAVEIADRILIFGSDPGRIRADIPITQPRPRAWDSAGFRQIVDQVYTLLTETGRDGRRGAKPEPIGIGYRLPDAAVQQLTGLIDSLTEAPFHGRADLPHLADEENLVMDELFPLIETLQLLGFAHVSGGDIDLTALGRAYAEADMLTRKQMFADAVLKHVPLAAHIRRVLDERPGHRAPAARFLRELEDHLSEEEAERVLDTVINWGRHAEIFAYDYDSEVLNLENF